MRRGLPAAVILFLLAPQVARAVGEPTPEIRFERLGPEDGLSHNTVNDLLQDRQGFLWIATDDGVDRYDGYEFLNLRPEPVRGASNVVMRLLEDSAGRFWAGTRTGLQRLDREGRRFVPIDLPVEVEGSASREVRTLTEGPRGGVWVGSGPVLFHLAPGADAFVRVPWDDGIAEPVTGPIQAIDWGPSRQPWILLPVASGSLAVPVLGPAQTAGAAVALPRAPSQVLHFDRGGGVWLGWPDPAVRPPPGWVVRRPDGIPDRQSLTALLEARDGAFWIGTRRGLFRAAPGAEVAEPLALAPGQSWQQSFVSAFLEDAAGTLWVGTLGGLYRHDPAQKPFRHLGHDRLDPESLGVGPVSAVLGTSDGTLWVGTFGGGLHRVDRTAGTIRRFRHHPDRPDSLRSDTIWALLVDGTGRLWIGTDDGLCSFDRHSERFTAWGESLWVTTLREGPSGRLWVGSGGTGLFELDVEREVWRRHHEARTFVSSLLTEAGELWFGRADATLLHLDPATDELESIPLVDADGRPILDLEIFDLLDDGDGGLWLATDGGLGRFDPISRQLALPVAGDEMPGSVVYSLLADAGDRLWLGTNRGLVRFDPDGPPEERVRTFDLADGVGNVEFNRHARFRSGDGEMFFGGMTGLTAFHPEEIRDNPYVPPVVLTEIRVLGEDGERRVEPYGLEELSLSPDDHAVSFEFAALAFTRPEKNRYAYRLEGLDGEWIAAGTERRARYTSLPPGSYTLRIRGANNDGVWNDDGVSLPVEVLPPFWRTWWFRLSVTILVGALLYSAHRVRLARLLEIERIRLRIAGDLHDDVASDLSGVALAADRVARQQELTEEDRQRLGQVRDTALGLVQNVRDIVWAIDPEHDTMEATVRRLRDIARDLLPDTAWTLSASPELRRGGIEMAHRRDLLLLVKEALHNVARHAAAERVDIELESEGHGLVVSIVDDGVGFDPEDAPAGHGLGNMRRRAASLGGELEIESAPGRGTRLTLRLPRTRDGRSRDAPVGSDRA